MGPAVFFMAVWQLEVTESPVFWLPVEGGDAETLLRLYMSRLWHQTTF